MSNLTTYHAQQMERVSSDFFEDGDGLQAVSRRTNAVDDIVRGRFDEIFAGARDGVAAIAVGGYGRAELFPFSDIDLLLLFGSIRDAERNEDRIAKLIASLWDSKLQVSHSVRSPRDCTSLARDNTDLHISMLDTRFVAGDEGFVATLQDSLLPKFYLREQRSLLRSLIQKARQRHQSFEDTLYHLEPNVKEGPGGLRDYHLACWVAQLQNIEPGRVPASGEFLPQNPWLDPEGSKRFLFALRCYLHYYYGRDSNVLSFDLQDSIAHASAGKVYDGPGGAADMMRDFYRRTRSVYRLALRLMDESSAPANALISILRNRKSRLSNVDFSVSNGQIYFKDPHLLEHRPERVLSLFEFQARHGLALASETERRIRDRLPLFRQHVDAAPTHWPALKRILLLPHTYRALEAMREAGVLYALFPDFELVDCLVIRDFYHRYTVDEHTLVAIRVLKELPSATERIDQRFASLLGEIDHAELLQLALLYHDLGKGVEGRPHQESSAEMAELGMRRIGLNDPLACETVIQLVADHLKMSEVMTKRDLSELSVLEDFKREVKTLERLKLLTLMTYADTVAVNPSAQTNWRKELLWRMYRGINSIFQRDHGDRRINKSTVADCLDQAADQAERKRLKRFLRGFPERYVRTHTPEQVRRHAELASTMDPGRAIAKCVWEGGYLEVLVLSPDRPFLFASLCAGITASGGDIVSAEAFANEDGLVLDSFRVAPDATAGELRQMDSAQIEDLELRLQGLAEGTIDASGLRQWRVRAPYSRRNGEPPSVSFDNDTSARATIFFVNTADRPKLLHDLASACSSRECDIDVVLSHTQGSLAMDTFYLTRNGEKLPGKICELLKEDLLEACAPG
ncbi:MAG: [protein-PII] uridylyltransferase [Bryobacterales bacterium]|nr:[protein-PII] uridylyltransferase [Bryobacterales bacterium]